MNWTYQKVTLLHLLFFGSILLSAQNQATDKITLSGYLTDATNGEALLYANVFIKNTSIGINSNEYGFYSLDIPKGKEVKVIFSYIGFSEIEKKINIATATTINVGLKPEGTTLVEAVVVSKRNHSAKEEIKSTQTSTINIPMAQIKSIPSLGGEVDIIKVVQLMPGIAKGGEGGSGMFVRGGDADQNLVLLDEATVYNIGHLFGFFSVFNPDALKDMTIVKGGFPAHYGGRLSSVLDIRMKEGNNQQFLMQGGIGLLSSRLSIEAPIIKNKASFLISGRRTYIDQVFKLAGNFLPYYFYDLNVKFNYKFSDKDHLFLSSYFGDDVLKFDQSDFEKAEEEEVDFDLNFGFQLGNFTQTIRWNHVYHPKLFSNLSLIHTSFNYDINGRVGDNSILVKSAIRDLGLKLDFTNYRSENTKLRYGIHAIYHGFRPNILNSRGAVVEFFIDDRQGDLQNTMELALYSNYEFSFREKWKFNTGLRLTGVAIKDKFYEGFEPRLSANYSIDANRSLKWSFSRMKQYMHRVSSSTISLPTDLWYPVSKVAKPQSSNQISFGYNQFFENKGLSLTVEGYYKTMKNLIEYKEGSSLIFNDDFEDLLIQGTGKSWGMEVLLRKQTGKINGWMGYTLAWANRNFDGLNNGETFWAKYDRRHNLTFVGNWELSKRVTFSAIWEFASGARFTPFRTQYLYPNAGLTEIEIVPVYSKRNEFRMSSSHRLDINFVLKNKPRKRFRTEWHLGAYNFYNRATPYSIRVQLDEETGRLQYVQPGLFGFIPSIGFNFNFQ